MNFLMKHRIYVSGYINGQCPNLGENLHALTMLACIGNYAKLEHASILDTGCSVYRVTFIPKLLKSKVDLPGPVSPVY